MNITDEAIKALAAVLVEDGAYGVPWGDASADDRAEALSSARRYLNIAAPHLTMEVVEVIPEAAVEVAAKVMQAKDVREGFGEHELYEYAEEARLILEAAAPHMLPVEQGSAMQEAMRLAWEQGWANARANYLALHQGQEIPEWVTLRNPYGKP